MGKERAKSPDGPHHPMAQLSHTCAVIFSKW
jgi:hypothetical protein